MPIVRLVEVTPEGRIVSALLEGTKSYGELKSATGLSHRWLSKKLKELSEAQVTERRGNRYRLTKPEEIVDADPLFAPVLQMQISPQAKARLIAGEISRDERVSSVILFGSLAKGQATEGSDIDLLIVTETEMDSELNDLVYAMMFKYDVPVEAVFLTLDELLANLQARTTFSFGLLEGYKILYDRAGLEGLLAIRRGELHRDWVYDEETGAWIQRKPRSISRPLTTS